MSATPITTTHTVDLPYEIDMLRASYNLFGRFSATDPWLKNLIIEGFWLHARNLIELFLGKRNAASLSSTESGWPSGQTGTVDSRTSG